MSGKNTHSFFTFGSKINKFEQKKSETNKNGYLALSLYQ
jgi:hypothetical protein